MVSNDFPGTLRNFVERYFDLSEIDIEMWLT